MPSTSFETTPLVAGLANPTRDCQNIFRQALKAISEPGSIVNVVDEAEQLASLGLLSPAMFALIHTLTDQQTTLWLADSFSQGNIAKNLQFHAGVELIQNKSQVMFACAMANEIEDISLFNAGTDESPEMSCSMLLQVAELDIGANANNHATTLQLTGPGIASFKKVSLTGLSPQIIKYLVERSHPFPRGLDFYFVSQQQLLCIPRTTKVEVI